MAITETSICNSALIKIGADRITALSDNNKRAILCSEQYSKLRDEVLQSHPWNFAIARVVPGKDATDPLFGWDSAFTMPSDVLRVLYLYPIENEIKWKKEGNKVLVNETAIKVVYIKKETDTSLFTPRFAEALSLRIAQELAYSLVQNIDVSSLMEQKYRSFLAETRSYNAQEGTPEQFTNDTFLNVRR